MGCKSYKRFKTFLSICKHCYLQSNEILINIGINKTLELKIKCMRFENIYTCRTQQQKRQGETQIWSNLMLI